MVRDIFKKGGSNPRDIVARSLKPFFKYLPFAGVLAFLLLGTAWGETNTISAVLEQAA